MRTAAAAIVLAVALTTLSRARNSPQLKVHQSLGEGKAALTVEDAVALPTLAGDGPYNDGLLPAGEFASYAPNHDQFVFVLKRGDIKHNTNEYSLYLWSLGEANRVLPRRLLQLSSSSNRPAIEEIRWLSDGVTVTFLGEIPGGHHELYSFNTSTQRLVQVTHLAVDLMSYSGTPDGSAFAFVAKREMLEAPTMDRRGLVLVLSDQSADTLFNKRGLSTARVRPLLFFLRAGDGTPRPLGAEVRNRLTGEAPVISPNGNLVVAPVNIDSAPESWRFYSAPADHYFTLSLNALLRRQHEITPLEQYVVIDTTTDATRVLLDAPTGSALGSEATWAPDSKSVVITNTFLPLDSRDDKRELARFGSQRFAVQVDVKAGSTRKIGSGELHSPTFLSRMDCLRLIPRTYDLNWNSHAPLFYRRSSSGAWQLVAAQVCDTPATRMVAVEEDMNDPPRLTVEDKSGQTSIAQWDLDPGLSKFTLARERLLNWIDSTGQAFEAGLYLPIGFRQGERYPLVVQTHGFNAKRFWVMGPYSGTAFAAQPLANAGFIVVQLDEDDSDVGSFQELHREVDRITSVISELSRRGLVDGMKVGIIGFSRTCLFTKAVLADAAIPIAAASVADGVDDGYFQYLLQNSLAFQSLSETAIGGIPFGEGLSHWEARSPGFNMNRVKTPLLIQALNAYSALFQWEWFAGLRRLDKPVEMIMLQDGTHILRKPWDRIASAQANVDWFRFWLQGYEDPNPAKSKQYRRWEKLCDMQVMEIPKQAVFCVGTRH